MSARFRWVSGLLALLLLGVPAYAKRPPLYARDSMLYPLFVRPQIAGGFAELRRTHYHGGLDFRTQQRCGLRVRSVEDGEIYQIGLSAKGYGKVLYVRHPDGHVSVYAHLSRFHADIEKMLRQRGLRLPRHREEPDILLSDWWMPVKRGQVIARSGNTGASGGPHLHFEWRSGTDESRDCLIHPGLYGWTVSDHTPPLLITLALYPMDADSRVNDSLKPCYLPVANLVDSCRIRGRIGFGIEALDSIEKLKFHYGLYALTFRLDGDTLAYYRFDSLPLRHSGDIRHHIDESYARQYHGRIEMSRVDETMPYTPYLIYKNGGCLTAEPGRRYRLEVLASDFNGNTSQVACWLNADESVDEINSSPAF